MTSPTTVFVNCCVYGWPADGAECSYFSFTNTCFYISAVSFLQSPLHASHVSQRSGHPQRASSV